MTGSNNSRDSAEFSIRYRIRGDVFQLTIVARVMCCLLSFSAFVTIESLSFVQWQFHLKFFLHWMYKKTILIRLSNTIDGFLVHFYRKPCIRWTDTVSFVQHCIQLNDLTLKHRFSIILNHYPIHIRAFKSLNVNIHYNWHTTTGADR